MHGQAFIQNFNLKITTHCIFNIEKESISICVQTLSIFLVSPLQPKIFTWGVEGGKQQQGTLKMQH